jgi:cytochrome oxidase assembly protein ShyY1
MRAGSFEFKFWPTIGTLVGLSLLVALGTWQFSRYQQKLQTEQLREARTQKPPVDVRSIDDLDSQKMHFRTARLHGSPDEETRLLVKHRFYNGDPGMWVLQPIELEAGGVVLANRGWIPFKDAEGRVDTLPSLGDGPYIARMYRREPVIADEPMRRALQQGDVTIRGNTTWWESFDVEGFYRDLPDPTPPENLVAVLSKSHSGIPYPIASTGHVGEPYLTSGRHLSYAVFWYAVGLALLAMYVANGFGALKSPKRRQRPRNRRSRDSDDEPETTG